MKPRFVELSQLRYRGLSFRLPHYRQERNLGKPVVRPPAEGATVLALSYAAPLLEEEWHFVTLALVADGKDPRLGNRTGARTAFAADNYPVDPTQIELPEVFEQWFDREKSEA